MIVMIAKFEKNTSIFAMGNQVQMLFKCCSDAVQMLLHLSRSLLIKLWLVRSTAFFAADA